MSSAHCQPQYWNNTALETHHFSRSPMSYGARSNTTITSQESVEDSFNAASMFGSKAVSLPPPFPHDHRTQRLYSEPSRPQPSGQCHFLMLHAENKEQRCACQGYQHNRNTAGTVCDCTHAACYHAQNTTNEAPVRYDNTMNNGFSTSALLDRIRKLEEAVQIEREFRENMMARERQSWEREIMVLREALYKSEEDMQQKLMEIEDKLEDTAKDQARVRSRVANLEDATTPSSRHVQPFANVNISMDQRVKSGTNGTGPHDGLYSGSEERTSPSAEPLSPKPSTIIVPEQESPRSSGILNLVELPRPALPRYAMPPRLSPPAESDEPRSSGFLALDVKELIHRRKLAKTFQPAQAYGSPSSSATKSPPTLNGSNMTPQSLPRVSPSTYSMNSSSTDSEDRVHKKRKHQAELMALDVLADVSAASPVMS